MKQNTISFLLTSDEIELLASIVYREPALTEILLRVKTEEDGLRIRFSYENLEDCLWALAYEAECESALDRRQKLSAFAQKLGGYKRLRRYMAYIRSKTM